MKNLENYGVQELDAKEMQETEGGFLGVFVVGLILGLFSSILFFND